MHILQPKHVKLNHIDSEKLLTSLNISLTQLPKIRITDSALPHDCVIGDIIKIERNSVGGKPTVYYRVITI
ncbi:MAG: DNA-directed RNA polymerase subunit RpoH/Rpb5 C-terminal domain-containing protein [Nanoarchaeota archaeon]